MPHFVRVLMTASARFSNPHSIAMHRWRNRNRSQHFSAIAICFFLAVPIVAFSHTGCSNCSTRATTTPPWQNDDVRISRMILTPVGFRTGDAREFTGADMSKILRVLRTAKRNTPGIAPQLRRQVIYVMEFDCGDGSSHFVSVYDTRGREWSNSFLVSAAEIKYVVDGYDKDFFQELYLSGER